MPVTLPKGRSALPLADQTRHSCLDRLLNTAGVRIDKESFDGKENRKASNRDHLV
jgi:hypothetical protein